MYEEISTDKPIKILVNGKTFYYTEEEFKTYYIGLLKGNLPEYRFSEIIQDNAKLNELILDELKRIIKYDGDPYGHIKSFSIEGWEKNHKMLEQGIIFYHENFSRAE